jgi:uncharacterized protein (DUF433 family)
MDESKLLERITVNSSIFGGKPMIRGHRLAVGRVLGMEDIQSCLIYARRLVGHERIELLKIESAA